jgi:hypothetical protein
MREDERRMLENLAHAAWVRRGRPLGSPEVDWEEAKRMVSVAERHESVDQELPPAAPGSCPTDLGAEPPPERSHDQPGR